MSQQRPIATRYTIEVWRERFGTHEWVETGFTNFTSQGEAEYEAANCFHPNGVQTRIVEYVTTSRVVSTSNP